MTKINPKAVSNGLGQRFSYNHGAPGGNSYKGSMFRFAYTPGEAVPETGVYWVYHYAHRISHPARLVRGQHFPQCHECGARVRFERATDDVESKAQPINAYTDFKDIKKAA